MILVTGGTGLVGAHLLLDLAREGHQIKALKRETAKLDYVKMVFDHYDDNADELFRKIDWIEGDIIDVCSLENAMQDVDYIYHSAAIVSFQKRDRQLIMKANVEGTANVVNAALNAGVKKLCYVSSIAALGRAENRGVTDENTVWTSSKENSVYSISKYNGEKEVWRGIEEGLDAVIVNPSIVFGLASPLKGSTQIFSTVWNGLKFYSKGVNGFVDVKDVVRIMIRLLESDIKSQRFVVNADNVKYRDIFWQIADVYNKPRPNIQVNRLMGGIAWMLFKVISLFTGKPPLVTKETARSGQNEYYYSNEKVRKSLGYNFIDLKSTIEETALSVKKYYLK